MLRVALYCCKMYLVDLYLRHRNGLFGRVDTIGHPWSGRYSEYLSPKECWETQSCIQNTLCYQQCTQGTLTLTRYFIYDSTHLNCKKWRNLIACGFDSTTIFNSEKSNFKQPLLQLGDTLRILCTLLLFDQIHFPKSEPCRAITYIQCTSHALIASAWELLVTVFKNKKLHFM